MIDALSPIRRRWNDWRGLLDDETLRAAYSPGHGIVVGCFLIAFALAGSRAPYVSGVLEVDAEGFLIAVGPAWALSMVLAVAFTRNLVPARAAPLLPVVGAGAVLYEAGCLVAFASERAAYALAGLVALTAVAQAQQGRSSLQYPFVLMADVVGLLAASLHARTAAHATSLLVVGGGGIVAGALVGAATIRSLRSRQRTDAMRSALEAQIAAERVAKAAALEGLVLDARARSHDVKNALTTALIDLEMLKESLDVRGGPEADEARGVLDALDTAIRLARMPVAPNGAPRREPVVLATALAPILRGPRSRFSSTTFDLELAEGAPLVAHVVDGAVGLRRILENLLVNAAEGDGARRAQQVVVRVHRHGGSATTVIEVEDDGPGFSPAQLAKPIEGFATTKPDGTGLGLYTVENLARASGGWIERANAPKGGAIVTVVLRAELGDEGAADE